MNITELIRNIKFPTIGTLVLILGTPLAGQAAQISSFQHKFAVGASNRLIGDGIAVSLDKWEGCCQSYFPLQTSFFTPSDVGSTVTFTDATNSNFSDFVALITNGVDDSILPLNIAPGIGSGGTVRSESFLFGSSVVGGNGIDLQGFLVKRITATVNELEINTPGQLGGTSWRGSITWGFHDDLPSTEPPTQSVPESSPALGLLALGTLGLGSVLLRKQKQSTDLG